MTLYQPRHFVTDDPAAIARVLDEFGFATLITIAGSDTLVSHVPVLADSREGRVSSAIGHVAAANPHAAMLGQGTSFLIFQGPYGYVSPNWYTAPAQAVPTWNYVAVHLHGSIERIDAADGKRTIVDALSAKHEAAFPQPWTSGKMDPALLQKLLGAIVGFRMTVSRIDAKFKLSQNRSRADREGVLAALEARDSAAADALADWMRQYAGE